MKPLGFLLKPVRGISLDRDELSMPDDMSKFIKNLCINVTDNPGMDGTGDSEGDNADTFTKPQANYLYIGDMVIPDGVNFGIGFKENKENNRGYVMVWNSRGNHFVYRIKGDGTGCEIIYKHPSLNFQLNPKYFIPPTRIAIESVCVTDEKGVMRNSTYIIFCDAFNEIKFIPEEDAIKTDSFNPVKYPFFNSIDPLWQNGYITNLGVQWPNRCIGIEAIPNTSPGATNRLLSATWQFRIKYDDRWGRPSEHGLISKPFYIGQNQGCSGSSTFSPRCLKLKIPAGPPVAENIYIEYRNCNGNADDITTPTDWSLYDTIKKYKDCDPGKQWFERIPNSILNFLTYNAVDNTFDYIFCGDKECTAIAVAQTNRLENPLPLTASGITKLGNSIAVSDLIEDYPPFNCAITDKIKYEVVPPKTEVCKPGTRKVRIAAVIQNLDYQQNVPVWKSHDSDTQLAWGGLAHNGSHVRFEDKIISDYQQGFPADVKGFPGYFLGTGIVGYSKQYILTNGVLSEDEFDDGRDNSAKVDIMYDIAVQNHIRVQIWDFENVPEGEQIFRVAGHNIAIQGINYEKTSTFVGGKYNASNYAGNSPNSGIKNNDVEIIVPCKGDYDSVKDSNTYLVICDQTKPRGPSDIQLASKTQAVCGYIRDFYGNPIELMIGYIANTPYHIITDHNGFYFFSQPATPFAILTFILKDKCKDVSPLKPINFIDTRLTINDITLTKAQSDCKANFVVIKGTLKDCNGNGISGMIVALTRGQYTKTDGNGNYSIIAHDNWIPEEHVYRNTDSLIIIQNGVCTLSRCADTCNTCLNRIPISLVPCFADCNLAREVPIVDQLYSLTLGNAQNGLKSGGTYRFGATGIDWMGRLVNIQNSEKDTLHIPSWQETGIMDFSTIRFTIDPSVVFPVWMKQIIFSRTKNLNGTQLQWVIDKAEYVDSTGNPNPAKPEKIKLYITGLNNYNLLNNFKTNTVYEHVKGDRVEFVVKSDGTLFPVGINFIVTDSKGGDYLLIDYDSRIADLKGGEKIEIQRAFNCEQKEFYFEASCTIDIVDGKPVQYTGIISTYDTYLTRRTIAYKNSSGILTGNIFPFPFEHHSPSDLWGDHCDDRGRINSVNPYERQICAKTKVRVSNAFVADKILNGLGRFDDADSFVFDEQEWGRITAMLPQLNRVLVLCEHANFVTVFKEDRIRQDKSGAIVGDTSIFGRPEDTEGSEYGCQIEDINTIQENKGIICFLDSSRNALVQHNYSKAVDASEHGEFKSWISSNVKYISDFNKNSETQIKYWHAVFDPKKNQYLLTIFTLLKFGTAQLPIASYVNQRREISFTENETIAYSPVEGLLKTFYAFTPEYYGSLFSDINDNQLICIKGGIPYFHYKANRNPGEPYNQFFGVQVLPMAELILSVEPNKVKRYMWNEVHCREQLFFADRIITEARQVSRLLKSQWEKTENFWKADFKCNLKTFIDPNIPALANPANVIFEGDLLYGKWIKIRYIGDPVRADRYCEFNGVNIFVNGSELSGTK